MNIDSCKDNTRLKSLHAFNFVIWYGIPEAKESGDEKWKVRYMFPAALL